MTQTTIPFQTAGTVDIHELVIFTGSGKFLDIKDYMSELNIYEDIFSPNMSGNFLFVDSRNLIKELPIVGEEYLYINTGFLICDCLWYLKSKSIFWKKMCGKR